MTTKAPDTVAAAWRWQQHDFRAMNTGVHLSLYTARKRPIGDHVVGLFRYFEQILSRFRPASELSRLNSHPDTAFAASPDLFAAVEAALWAAQQTEGIYDPTILPALERAGYDRTFDALTTAPLTRSQPDDLFLGVEPAADFSFHDVMLDSFTQTIYRPVGLRLDLGGMGKGWTADRVADDLRPKGAFMLNAGGDMVVERRAPPPARLDSSSGPPAAAGAHVRHSLVGQPGFGDVYHRPTALGPGGHDSSPPD